MKLHYFSQLRADKDDHVLVEAKKKRLVPFNCLLGGALVLAISARGRKPCDSCGGPRDRCGGAVRKSLEELLANEECRTLYNLLNSKAVKEESAIDDLLKIT